MRLVHHLLSRANLSFLSELVVFNVKAKLEAEAAQDYLGYLWWLLEPLSLAFTYYVVFSVFLKAGEPNYIAFLFVGVIVWRWFSSIVSGGSASIYNGRGLYRQIYLPKIMFPWIESIFYTFKFCVIFFAVTLTYALMGFPLTLAHCSLPLLMIGQLSFALGLATILASIFPFFVDLKTLIGLALRLAFYPSGVIFNLKRIPAAYHWVIDYNPVAQGIIGFRGILLHGQSPTLWSLLFPLLTGILLYLVGVSLIGRFDKRYAML